MVRKKKEDMRKYNGQKGIKNPNKGNPKGMKIDWGAGRPRGSANKTYKVGMSNITSDNPQYRIGLKSEIAQTMIDVKQQESIVELFVSGNSIGRVVVIGSVSEGLVGIDMLMLKTEQY